MLKAIDREVLFKTIYRQLYSAQLWQFHFFRFSFCPGSDIREDQSRVGELNVWTEANLIKGENREN